jgi:FtsZ-binding cell division protein ZapB
MGGSNILNGDAMQAIARIEDAVRCIPEMQKDIASLTGEQKVFTEQMAGVRKSIEELPSKCPYVAELKVTESTVEAHSGDIKDLKEGQQDLEQDMREVKTNQRWLTGGNAAYTTILVTLSETIKGFIASLAS